MAVAAGDIEPFAVSSGLARHHQCRAGIEEHDVAECSLFTVEERLHALGICRGIAASQRVAAGTGESQVFRLHLEARDLPVFELGNHAGAHGGELVHAFAMHHPGALAAELAQHLRERTNPLRRKHAQQLPLGVCRIRERSQ